MKPRICIFCSTAESLLLAAASIGLEHGQVLLPSSGLWLFQVKETTIRNILPYQQFIVTL